MSKRLKKNRFWRICRIYFRRFRIAVWLLLLFLLGALIYINQIGLPGFIKRPLLEKLQARGLDLQFSRVRFRWHLGIVAENVRFGRADDPLSPQLRLAEVQVRLNLRALARFQLQVDSLMLRQGKFTWPIAQGDLPARQMSIDNIQTELRLLPNDQWSLDHFTAGFAGANIRLSGDIANASAVRDWQIFHPKTSAPAGAWQKRLNKLADTLEGIHFSAPPDLVLDLRGDAHDLQTFQARMLINTPGAQTPWGTLTHGRFAAHVLPATNEQSRAEISLEALTAQTRWGSATNLHLHLQVTSVESQTNLVGANMTLTVAQVDTRWATASNANLSAQWVHALTNPIPLKGEGLINCEGIQSRWATAAKAHFATHLTSHQAVPGEGTNVGPSLDLAQNLAWWTNILPYNLDWECQFHSLVSSNLAGQELTCGGTWSAPRLSVTNLEAKLYEGRIDAQAGLDITSRLLEAKIISDIDPHKVSSLLTEGARHWLGNFSWPKPPEVKGELSVVFPEWTNRHPDWRGEVRPTLKIQGEFNLSQGGAFRGVPVTNAHSHLSYSNMFWLLPDLKAARPEGNLEAAHISDDRTKNFYWRIHSTIYPTELRSMLSTNQQRGLDFVTLNQPPQVDAELWGRWHDPERLGARGHVAVTNFSFRGQAADSFVADLSYTNRYLVLRRGQAWVGTQHLSADGLGLDFSARKLYLTNGVGTADPGIITRAIGSNAARIMAPYQFGHPPTAHVYGTIPLRPEDPADLHFQIHGGPFHWWRLNVDTISGSVDWVGDQLTLSNVHAQLYGGQTSGSAIFDFHHSQGTDFFVSVNTTNTQLQGLMRDASTNRSKLEGLLSGAVVVTRANSARWRNLDGYGNVQLRDGLIWDIPIFGIFSEVLNGIAPGLGNSRANAGACTFGVTNGVIRTDDLEIHSSAMRMQYRGTLDLETRVNVRTEAELLRDLWGVGPLISTVFWPVTKLFEYKVTGTLSHPKSTPVFFIPRIVLMPFHPLRTLRDLLPEASSSGRTNAPFKSQ